MPAKSSEEPWGWFLDRVDYPGGRYDYLLMRPDLAFYRYGVWMHFPLPSEFIPTPANEP